MRIIFFALVGFMLSSQTVFGQEIGSIINGTHSVTILKSNDLYACIYSDIDDSRTVNFQKSFNFPNKETIYNIIIDGFKNKNNHQIYVQTDKNTVIKFDYKRINGIIMLKIKHNNLQNNVVGISTFLTQEQIRHLFGENEVTKA